MLIEDNFTGILPDIPNEVYHNTNHLSSTQIKLVKKSLRHFKELYGVKEKKSSFDFGTCAHAFILEDKEMFVKAPELNKNSNAYKSWKAEQDPGKLVLDQDEIEQLYKMKARIVENTRLQSLIDKSEKEVSYFTDVDGLFIKARPDLCYIFDDGFIILDYKTTTSCTHHNFSKAIYDYGYDTSAAHYIFVCEKLLNKPCKDYYWIAHEKSSPYEVKVYRAADKILFRALDKWREYISKINKALEENDWPGYTQDFEEIDLPEWVYKGEENGEI